MLIIQDDPAAPHVADLLAFHLQDVQRVMGEHAFALDAIGLSAPDITFWTAWADDALVGFGAVKQLDESHGEVKSMRAAPNARGTGVGRALLEHIIAEARTRRYTRLSLETGTAALHAPAIGLYRSAGFVSRNPFANYQASVHNQYLTLDLSA